MRLLFLGDMVGKSGREAVCSALPGMIEAWKLDFVIVNGENAAGGFGITEAIVEETLAAGADVITTGNHVWDQREALIFADRQDRFLRPANYPAGYARPRREHLRGPQRRARHGREHHGPRLHVTGAGRPVPLRRDAFAGRCARQRCGRHRHRFPCRGDERENLLRAFRRRARFAWWWARTRIARPPITRSSMAARHTYRMPACAATITHRSAWTRKSRSTGS